MKVNRSVKLPAGSTLGTNFKEKINMATMTRTNKVSYKSKSDHVRALLDQGKTIAEITRLVPNMGYAFAYGIAKRYGKTETAANRKSVKQIKKTETTVEIITKVGLVIVNLETGAVSKKK